MREGGNSLIQLFKIEHEAVAETEEKLLSTEEILSKPTGVRTQN